MDKKEAIFIDFDGTLYDRKNHTISKNTVDSIQKARENGVKIFLCTGRSMASLEEMDVPKNIDLDGWICVNGQEIYDKDLNVLQSETMHKDDTKRIIDYMNDHGQLAVVASTDKGFVLDNTNIHNLDSEKSLEELNKNYNTVWTDGNIDNYKTFNYSIVIDTDKFSDEDLLKIERDLNQEEKRYEVTRSHKYYFDITLKDYTKATAIEFVKREYKIDYTYGIGDAPNDHEMLKIVDVPVAMGNADDKTKRICSFVTDPVENGGVGTFIDKLINREIVLEHRAEIEPFGEMW